MHETRDGKLRDGKDGQGLSCTTVRRKSFRQDGKDAHVLPRFPKNGRETGRLSSANPEGQLADHKERAASLSLR